MQLVYFSNQNSVSLGQRIPRRTGEVWILGIVPLQVIKPLKLSELITYTAYGLDIAGILGV